MGLDSRDLGELIGQLLVTLPFSLFPLPAPTKLMVGGYEVEVNGGTRNEFVGFNCPASFLLYVPGVGATRPGVMVIRGDVLDVLVGGLSSADGGRFATRLCESTSC